MSDTHFKILIAGKVVEIFSLYDCVHEFCLDYLTDKAPDFVVRLSEEDITRERERDDKGGASSRIPSDYPDSYLEVLACYRRIADKMCDFDILLMHGSAVSIDGLGVMFAASSTTGKSTHAGIWKRLFKSRLDIINDDKPLIKVTERDIFVCGTPWSGKKGLNTAIDVPLKTIYRLERFKEGKPLPDDALISRGNNSVYRLDDKEKWQTIASQSYKSDDPVRLARSMALIDKIIQRVPIKGLICDMSDEAAFTALEGVGCGDIS